MTRTSTLSILSRALFASFIACMISSCNGRRDIPLPEDGGYAPPDVTAITFGPEEPLVWTDKPLPLTTSPSPFPFAKLPEYLFDSSGFRKLGAPPDTVRFEMAALPTVAFDFEKLPDVKVRRSTLLLPPPERISMPRPTYKNAREIVFDFPPPLNSLTVNGMVSDHTGNTWMLTSGGIIRYDGETILRYMPGTNFSNISSVVFDRDNVMWFAMRNSGLTSFDPANGTGTQFDKTPGFTPRDNVQVYIDSKNRIWASCLPPGYGPESDATSGYMIRVDEKRETAKIWREADGLTGGAPTGVVEDANHNFWFTNATRGVRIYDGNSKQLRTLGMKEGLSIDSISTPNIDSSGRILLPGQDFSTNIVEPSAGIIIKAGKRQGLPSFFNVPQIQTDREGNLYRGSDRGLMILNRDLTAKSVYQRPEGLNALSGVNPFFDARNQLLVGNRLGVQMFRKNGLDIRKRGTVQVSTMLEDTRGRIWIGSLESGIMILDRKTNRYKLYDAAHGLADNFIQYMTEYDGQVLISTQAGGLEIIDTALRQVERIGGVQGVTGNLTTMETDQDKNIWIGGLGQGLDVIDPRTKSLRHLGTGQGIKDSAMAELKRDRKGLLWFISGWGGVGYIDPVKKTIRHIVKSGHRILTAGEQDVLLKHDSRGNTWVMTSTKGFLMINPTHDSVSYFGPAQGVAAATATSIGEYNGRMYLALGSNGLTVLTPPDAGSRSWKVDAISKYSGLTKTVRSYNSDLITRDGEFWWGDDGITIIRNTDKGFGDSTYNETYITGLNLEGDDQYYVANPWKYTAGDTIGYDWGGARQKLTSKSDAKDLPWLQGGGLIWDSLDRNYYVPVNPVFPYDKNVIQFQFAQVHLGARDSVYYRYILEGFDQKWSAKMSKPFSEFYRNIPPGRYTFKVTSTNRGVWGKPVEYSFTVSPPWWRTWWAYLIYALMLGVLLRGYVVYRSRRLRRENKVLEEKIHLRTQQLQHSIEELKATQGQLIQSEKMASLGELTAGIAHEIQNPLNFINNFAEVNMELLVELTEEIDKGNPAAAKELAQDVINNEQKINHHGKRADGIVKSMLQHSRGNANTSKEPTDLNKLADEYLRLAYHGLRAKDKSFNAALKTDFDPGVGMVNIMANDIGRVILNLITNAFYAVGERKKSAGTGYEPTVSVSSGKAAGRVELKIADNGGGIAEKVREKIFQPFFTTKPAGQGTGLGLSLAYDIVKAHNGELHLDTKEGQGTTFTIVLPA
ncbi:MAG: hypothetical protein EOO09_10215 [Chitinophagaceae bacterium]|nr:MAG: hypothetical protein EOO09_10215 [Chitinophagaceae bacterium]